MKLEDGRRREVKLMRRIQAELASALGNDLSPQEVLLVQNVSVKAIRCSLMGSEILRTNGNCSERVSQDYLRYSRELRSDLMALGLQRRTKTVQSLEVYAEKEYGS